MRLTRALIAGFGLTLAVPALAAAQQGSDFENSWFWGIQGGGLAYGAPSATSAGGNLVQAPTAGVEWLITRTHGGLYVAASQAFLSQQTLIANGPTPSDSGFRTVDLKDMRSLDVALMAFPGTHVVFHPYIGGGFTFNDIATASPEGPFTTQDQINFAEESIQTVKSAFSPLLLAGVQWRLPRVSAFAQVKLEAANTNFLLYSGRAELFAWEIGLRYNIGSSIADDK